MGQNGGGYGEGGSGHTNGLWRRGWGRTVGVMGKGVVDTPMGYGGEGWAERWRGVGVDETIGYGWGWGGVA